MSITIYDNNPDIRRAADNLHLVRFHDKFFEPNMTKETRELKELCMQFAHASNYTLCGVKIPREFEPPEFTDEEMENLTEQEMENIRMKAELDYGVLNFKRVKLIPFPPKILNTFEHDQTIDPRIVYIADMGNHCIRRIVIKLANVDTFAGMCG